MMELWTQTVSGCLAYGGEKLLKNRTQRAEDAPHIPECRATRCLDKGSQQVPFGSICANDSRYDAVQAHEYAHLAHTCENTQTHQI